MNYKEIEDFAVSVELIQNDEKLILIYEEKNFYIQKFFYDLLISIRANNFTIALDSLKNSNNLSASELISIRDYLIEIIIKIIEEKEEKKYINFSYVLLKETSVNFLANKFKFLFNRNLLIPLFLLSLVCTIYCYFQYFYKTTSVINISFQESIAIYILFFIIMLFHEVGHASATAHFKIKPKEIGIGFYLIFPVLFANVTKIWKLERSKRILINLGGIYFQLVCNIILTLLIVMFPSTSHYLVGIVKLNILVSLYALIPFIRNDGYWVYSDYFDIQNLNKKSNNIPFKIFKKIFRKEEIQPISSALFLYSLGNYTFILLILYKYFSSIPLVIKELRFTIMYYDVQTIFSDHFQVILNTCISIFFTYILLKELLKFVNSNKT